MDDGSRLVEYSVFAGGDTTKFSILYKPDGRASIFQDIVGNDIGQGIIDTLSSVIKVLG